MNQNTARKTEYVSTTRYITEGNTVRVVRPDMDPYYEREVRRKLAMERRRQRLKEEAQKQKRRQKLNFALPVVIVLCIGIAVIVYFGYMYLSLQSSVDNHNSVIGKLETQLESLKVENDALEQSIETNLDLSYVYDVAVHKLGMVHAGAENIIQYEKTESEYVRQYDQIPEF